MAKKETFTAEHLKSMGLSETAPNTFEKIGFKANGKYGKIFVKDNYEDLIKMRDDAPVTSTKKEVPFHNYRGNKMGKKEAVEPEKELTRKICSYIKETFPHVYFFTDPSGMFQKSWDAKTQLKNNRSHHHQLDLIILHPMHGFHGAVIELKREGEKLLNKGEEYKTPHLKEQFTSIEHLRKQGYYAHFGIGYEKTKKLINDYLTKK